MIGYSAYRKWPIGQNKIPLVFIFLSIAFATVSNKEAWWARYVPHLWFLTALVLVGPSFSRFDRIVRTIVIVLCLTTSIPTTYYTFERNYKTTLSLKKGIDYIKSKKNNIVVFSQMKFFDISLKALLEDNDIPFIYAKPTDKLRALFVYKLRGNKRVVVCRKIIR